MELHADYETAELPPEPRTCCLCDGADFEIVDTLDRHGAPLVTVMCRHCGLISHRDIPSDDELTEFYESRYRLEYHGQQEPAPRRVMRAWRNGHRIAEQVQPFLREGSRLLEVGAGLGCTVRQLQDRGFDAEGIDPGRAFTSFSVESLGARMSQCTLARVDQTQRDAVLMIHVIEHLNAPDLALRQVRRLLPDGGLLYVECPNVDAPVARRSQLFHFAHIYSFTPTTLQMLAELSGFELVRQFGRRHDPNLQMLFRRCEARRFEITPDARGRTLARIRMGRLRYHLRPRYLASRVRKLSGYLVEKMVAERYVRNLIQACAESGQSEPRSAEPAVTVPFPRTDEVRPVRRAA